MTASDGTPSERRAACESTSAKQAPSPGKKFERVPPPTRRRAPQSHAIASGSSQLSTPPTMHALVLVPETTCAAVWSASSPPAWPWETVRTPWIRRAPYARVSRRSSCCCSAAENPGRGEQERQGQLTAHGQAPGEQLEAVLGQSHHAVDAR